MNGLSMSESLSSSLFRAERLEALTPADPQLGRWIWKASCVYCGCSFGGYERDYTDPLKEHDETCQMRPDNNDDCEGDHNEY